MASKRLRIASVSSTLANDRSRTEIWDNDAFSPADLPSRLGVDGLPELGVSTFFEDPALLARAFTASERGGSGSIITVTYATTRFAAAVLSRSTVDLAGSKFTFDYDFELETVTIPYAVLVPVAVNSGDLSGTGRVWLGQELSVVESRATIHARFEIQNANFQTARIYNAQNNKIHSHNGSKWRFNVSSIRSLDNTSNPDGIFEVNASWTEDIGTPNPGYIETDDIKYPLAGLIFPDGPNIDLLRLPYHRIGIRQGSPIDPPAGTDIRNEVPKLFDIPLYKEVPDGWTTLNLPPGLI